MSGGPVAFVLGGGGVLGAVEVGMLRALLEYGIAPDLIVGTSIGAVNGVLVAADPNPAVTDRLAGLWSSPQARAVYGDSPPRQLARIARGRTHMHSARPLQSLLERELGADTEFADLPVRFQCDGQHYIDGGIVNSIPVGRAVELGAGTVFVLQVGRIDRPLSPPRHVLDVAKVAFEVSRRHRYARELAATPSTVDVHVLPTGGGSERDDSPLAYRDLAAAARRITRAYEASVKYLKDRLG
ncbi:MAG: patatin [Actinobacteria bacterium 13_2_20CM_2_72_6]|nr:MAG: patatin [Actinobacteria bacterium 13_2_20CM_2_72_6]